MRHNQKQLLSGWHFLIVLSLIFLPLITTSQIQHPYQDSKKPVEDRVSYLLLRMTLEEKIDMLGGYEGFYIRPNERLGIPRVKMADGPLGVRNYGKATAFPSGIAFAATWDTVLAMEYGKVIGEEARSKGVHIMLAPGVNIYRAPMCGRNFEYYGEDPFLASRMAVAYIKGVQSQEVVATIKHFAANNQEWDRNNVSSDMDERTLREIYLPTFRAAVEEAHVGAVMNAYNLVNGVYCSQHNHLIRDILKGDWNFDGIIAEAEEKTKVYFSSGLTSNVDEMVRNSAFISVNQKEEEVKGLRGEYFTTIDMSGEPILTRVDPFIQFDWQNYSPAAVIPVDSFSVRWTGKIHPEKDGNYYFFVGGNNGFRLFLDDTVIINEWNNPSFLAKNKTIALQGGRDYRIKLEFYENRGEVKQVTIELPECAFSYYDPEKKSWTMEPGEFEILIGSSSRDIRLKKTIKLN